MEEAPALRIQPSYLVLDGQQRLTSLYQAICGVGQSRFFLDVGAVIAGSEVNEAVRVFSAERAAPLDTRQAQADALMMPLSVAKMNDAAPELVPLLITNPLPPLKTMPVGDPGTVTTRGRTAPVPS